MPAEKIKKNHSRITILLEGDLNDLLISSCGRSCRSKRAEIFLRIKDSLIRFNDLPISKTDENNRS
ncbi:TraY domain-containing protein [Shewanella sp. ZOR0012]|uniref:TraY domain-containing protein n=1 Tax=Shewanella sp. ZOR0012 TaxID=1339231 RepID=UPI0009DFF4DA|nr:TraY domain-containing protein [Shewanella sp. ZOR0012]NSM26894.1 TraY domain-containing protein [Shewanella sp. ZOR0012]